MTDYFNFPKLSTWWEKKTLLAEGFTKEGHFLNRIKIFQRQSDYAMTFTDSIGRDQLMQFEEMFPPTVSFFTGLHSLTISAELFVTGYIGKVLDTSKHTLKRLYLRGGFWALSVLENEKELAKVDACFKKVQDIELDELCLNFSLDRMYERIVDIIKTNKARRLRLICSTSHDIQHNVKLWEEVMPLQKLSEIDIIYMGAPLSTNVIRLGELIDQARAETLQRVFFNCLHLFDGVIFSKTLHNVLLDVCICLCDIGISIYHVYFILEFLPAMRGHNRAKVVQALERIFESINAVKERRTEKLGEFDKKSKIN